MTNMIAATLAALGSLAMAGDATMQPVQLDVRPQDGRIVLVVTGASPTEMDARYSLSVSSGGAGNRSTHAGKVHLLPGKPQTMSTVTMSVAKDQPWTVTLDVVPSDGAPYTLTRTSD